MAKVKDFSVNINPAEVLYTAINTSKDGYNSARIVAKRGDKQYLSVSLEWEGGGIPDFAMDLVDFMKSNNMETSGVWSEKDAEYEEFAAKMTKKQKQEMKQKMQDEENMDEEMMDDEEDDTKKNKKSKK